MWDRFRQKGRVAPSLNRKKLEAWQNSHSSTPTSASRAGGVKGGNGQYQYAVRGGPAPKRPPLRDVGQPQENAQRQSSAYMAVPPVHAPSTAGRAPQRDPAYDRPVSSVYSQPSQAASFAADQLRNDVAHPDPLEVSPPSSPDIASHREGPNPGDVSPIDESPDAFQLDQARHTTPTRTEPRSNIPMMRRERRKNSDAAMSSLRDAKLRDRTTPPRAYDNDVRGDHRTAEPTTSAKSRLSQLNLQDYAHGLAGRADAASSTQSGPSKPSQLNPSSLRDRLRPVRQTSPSLQPEPAPRPEWRGASGRTAIVPPVRDDLNVAPLNVPPKSNKSAGRNPQGQSPVESNNASKAASSPLQNTSRVPPAAHNNDAVISAAGSSVRKPPQFSDTAAENHPSLLTSAYPISTLTKTTAGLGQPPAQETSSQPQPLQIASNDKATRRKPTWASPAQQLGPSTPAERSQHDTAAQASTNGPLDWIQPQSRFSFTTYATSDRTATPRASLDEDSPPLPTPNAQPAPTVSILDRGRPIVSGYEKSSSLTPNEPVKISLESPYYPASTSTAGLRALIPKVMPVGNDSTLSAPSTSPQDKSLPPAPPEASATDRVAELNAQLGALGNRRININIAIRQMTEMMPTDNVLASEAVVRKREEEKRKVEVLRTELADVERQSYELGLRLHRAYKRLDRDAEYEPTTLWVRRVTN